MQPHTFVTPPPPQLCGGVQLPHPSCPPQPFGSVPQFLPSAAHVLGVQPQTFDVPPPAQLWGAVQVPQLSVPPQPFEIEPQFFP